MKNYKVIKEFASAQKGDMLTYNEDTNLYEFSMTTEMIMRSVHVIFVWMRKRQKSL